MSELPPSNLDPETPFVDRLEEQLRTASARHIAANAEPVGAMGRPRGRGLALAAVVLVVVGSVLFWPRGQNGVAADFFEIEQKGSSVEVSVVDLVDNRDEAIEELAAVGLDVDVTMVPVSPALVGQLVSVSSLGGEEIQSQSADGVAVDSFVAVAGGPVLAIEVGQAASGDELYLYSSEPALCDRLSGSRLTVEIRDVLGGSGHSIRWLLAEGTAVEEVTAEQLGETQVVVTEVVRERLNSSVVLVAKDLTRTDCRS